MFCSVVFCSVLFCSVLFHVPVNDLFLQILKPTITVTMALWVDSVSNRNEYHEYSLGDKGGRCVGLTTLSPSFADCHEIWAPQPTGTLRACPGLQMFVYLYLYPLQLQQLLLLLEIIRHFNIKIICVLFPLYNLMLRSNIRTRVSTVNDIKLLVLVIQKSCLLWCKHLVIGYYSD